MGTWDSTNVGYTALEMDLAALLDHRSLAETDSFACGNDLTAAKSRR